MKRQILLIIVFFTLISVKAQIVINEINYKDEINFQTKDWIELYNNDNSSVDVSNWVFKDNDDLHEFIIPNGTIMQPNTYLVLTQFLGDFQTLFPSVSPVLGDFTFGLSGGGELIRLFNASGTLIDAVEYDDIAPWPTEPDGNGPTLELINPNLDNALAESWSASTDHGTPGEQNSAFVLGLNNYSNTIFVTVYPNPLTDKSTIKLSNELKIKSILIYDIIGNEVNRIQSNVSTIFLEKGNLNSGIYMLQIITENDRTLTQKLIIK